MHLLTEKGEEGKEGKSKILIFGGRHMEGISNDIFSFDIDTKEWTKFEVNMPSELCSHSSVIVNNRYIVIYGGTNGHRFFDNILRCDL